jgi:hypothetical protein
LSVACNFAAGAPQVVPTAVPAEVVEVEVIVEVTPTKSAFAPEEANAGPHYYWMSPNENGCDASDNLKVPQFRDKEMAFSADYSSVTYGERTYPRVGDHRYQSINQSDKPLVLIFSEHGYVLHVYRPGDDPNVAEACLTFSFTLAD